MNPIPLDALRIESADLFVPNLYELSQILSSGLSKHFKDVSVNVIKCPDLRQEPFHLASEGICGSPRLLDIGGVPYLLPSVNRSKMYDMKYFSQLTELNEDRVFIIGAGAAPWTLLNRNAELVPNLLLYKNEIQVQKSKIARTFDEGKNNMRYCQIEMPSHESKMSLLGNVFISEGKEGNVLEIKIRERTGKINLFSVLRQTLESSYESPVGFGGVIVQTNGTATIHVMPDFSPFPLVSESEIQNWLEFYQVKSPFVCLSTLLSKDPGLDCRLEHTHGFSLHGDCGHYHTDDSPDIVEYYGIFNIAERIYRVDRPSQQ